MKILFLDVDGVCNSKETLQRTTSGVYGIDPYMAFMVGKIQLDTGCEVVLSSTWRYGEESRKEIRERVVNFIDVTPNSWYHKEFDHHSIRGEEIQKWLNNHPEVTKYAILDDDSDMLPEQLTNFFQTSWEKGLTEEIAKRVTEHLK